jgi:protein-S-isoprenylcysteine O-methyltransferase Ste14
MYLFLIPLLLGFASNMASAFTTKFSRWWGERRGSLVSLLLRNIFGIPVWTLGFLLAGRTTSASLFTSTTIITVLGWLLIMAGGTMILIALITIQWKAIKPSIKDTLVRNGLYRQIRHPIHAGTILEFIGIVLVVPRLNIALACTLGVIWVVLQTRLEEIDLRQRLPDYREYMNTVPRFLPRFRRR